MFVGMLLIQSLTDAAMLPCTCPVTSIGVDAVPYTLMWCSGTRRVSLVSDR